MTIPSPTESLLQWHLLMGVDETIGDSPKNWFEPTPAIEPAQMLQAATIEPAPTSAPIEHTEKTSAPSPAMLATHSAMQAARIAADSASSLGALNDIIRAFDGCPLKTSTTKTVVMDGNLAAKILLIGDAPDADDDEKCLPFGGQSGALLDKMLGAIGWSRDTCLITNIVYWRASNNRQPSPDETLICKPFVEKFIELMDPELIVVIGGTAAKAMLGTDLGISKLRGKTYSYLHPKTLKTYTACAIFHPSYLLRQPAYKRQTWQDLLMLRNLINDPKIPA